MTPCDRLSTFLSEKLCPMNVRCVRATAIGPAYEGSIVRFESRSDVCHPVITLVVDDNNASSTYTMCQAARIFEMRFARDNLATGKLPSPKPWLMRIDVPPAYESIIRSTCNVHSRSQICVGDLVPQCFRFKPTKRFPVNIEMMKTFVHVLVTNISSVPPPNFFDTHVVPVMEGLMGESSAHGVSVFDLEALVRDYFFHRKPRSCAVPDSPSTRLFYFSME